MSDQLQPIRNIVEFLEGHIERQKTEGATVNKGIGSVEIFEDLMTLNDFADEYAYGRDAQDNLIVEHYGEDGEIEGTQTLTITLGEFKAATNE